MYLGAEDRLATRSRQAFVEAVPEAVWTKASDRASFLRSLLSFFPHIVILDQALNASVHGHPLVLLRRLYPLVPVFLIGKDVLEAEAQQAVWGLPTPCQDSFAYLWTQARPTLARVQSRVSAMRIRYEIRRNVEALGDIEAGLRSGRSEAEESPAESWIAEIRASIAYLERLGRELRG
ncbi:MAG: hypothetical protein D6722_06115 [Bacteroidetes bacterium]|nr:MAG: hypothetical protein D6722_06115 [Bacteroidota bacterium]